MRDKKFLKMFFSLYVALVLQNVVTLSVNLADNIMLGAYGEVSLSGVAAVNQVQFIYQQLLFGFADGLVIFCSQYWGQKNIGPMKKIAAMAMQCGLLTGVVLFVVVSLFPYQVVGCFTTDQAIIQEGVTYLRTIRYTYLFFAVIQMTLAALRSTEVVKIALYLSLVSLGINCCMNYILIFGNFGAPSLGVTGAAIGTLTARVIEFMILIIYVAKKEKNLRMRLQDYLIHDFVLMKDYLKMTAPILMLAGLWGLNTALQTAILGHMTSAAIAANSAASNLFLMVKSTGAGAAAAAGVIIGKTIGEGDMQKVREYAKRLQILFISIGLCAGIFLFFIRIPVLSLYNLSDESRRLANIFLMILSVVYVGTSYQMPTNNGIIKGGGSVSFVVKEDLISIWGIVIPLSFIMAFVVKASPVVVVWCLNLDQIFKCVPAFCKANFGHWAKKLTR